MRAIALSMSALIAGFVLAGQYAMAADDVRIPVQGGTIIIPQSSIPKPADAGKAAHTNVEIFRPNQPPAEPPAHPPGSPDDGPGK
jgi:hypothetical protein